MILHKFIFTIAFVLLLGLASCFTHHKAQRANMQDFKNISIRNVVADSLQNNTSLGFLQAYRKELQSSMGTVIGQCEAALKKEKPNGSLGNLVCDAMLFKAQQIDSNCQLAVANYGGIRLPSLQKGTITLNSVYELMPFENTISIIELSGALIDSFCQKIAKAGGMPIGGMQFFLNNKKAENIKVQDQNLDYTKKYKVAVNSYMAAGGDNCEFLIPLPKKNTSALIRNAIAEFIAYQNKNNHPLLALPVERILTK
jgi:2',3'-cyclic-nucleotide 2'-phosphodiesterase (5'-nucleotidase family)